MKTAETILVLSSEGFLNWTSGESGEAATARFYGDQPKRGDFRCNKTRQVGSVLTERDGGLPGLLRTLAGVAEQEGATTVEGLAEAITTMQEAAR